MTVADLVEKFLIFSSRKGCKPSSLRHYRGRLKWFVAAFGTLAPADVRREDVLNGLHLVGQKLGNNTRRSNIVCLELLQNYAIDFDHMAGPWIRKKDVKKPPQVIRERIATPEETLQILKAASGDFGRVYRALRLTGARPGELAGATIADVKGEGASRMLVLLEHKTANKTGAPRKIPIGEIVAPLFDAAIAGRAEGRIFLDRRGQPWDRDRLSRYFRRIRDKLGLSKDLVLYSARHEFATAVAKEFGILETARLLGHTNVTMSQRYAKTPEERLREVQGKAIKDVDLGD